MSPASDASATATAFRLDTRAAATATNPDKVWRRVRGKATDHAERQRLALGLLAREDLTEDQAAELAHLCAADAHRLLAALANHRFCTPGSMLAQAVESTLTGDALPVFLTQVADRARWAPAALLHQERGHLYGDQVPGIVATLIDAPTLARAAETLVDRYLQVAADPGSDHGSVYDRVPTLTGLTGPALTRLVQHAVTALYALHASPAVYASTDSTCGTPGNDPEPGLQRMLAEEHSTRLTMSLLGRPDLGEDHAVALVEAMTAAPTPRTDRAEWVRADFEWWGRYGRVLRDLHRLLEQRTLPVAAAARLVADPGWRHVLHDYGTRVAPEVYHQVLRERHVTWSDLLAETVAYPNILTVVVDAATRAPADLAADLLATLADPDTLDLPVDARIEIADAFTAATHLLGTPAWDQVYALWSHAHTLAADIPASDLPATFCDRVRGRFPTYLDPSVTPPEHRFAAWLAAQADPVLRAQVVALAWTPAQVRAAATDPSPQVRLAVLAHDLLSPALHARLLGDPDGRVRAQAVTQASDPDQVAAAATDSDPRVRLAVARHSQIPAEVLPDLVADPDPEVRAAVADRWTAALAR